MIIPSIPVIMAKKKKISLTYKFAIIGGVLIICQVLFVYVFREDKSQTAREAIEKAVAKQNQLPPERRSQLKVQLAVVDYMSKNQQKPPKVLDDLVPTYFDTVPLDQKSGKPFRYEIVDGVPFVGDMPSPADGTAVASADGTIEPLSEADREQALLIASLEQPAVEDFVYDPSGRRDPFLPYSLAPEGDDPTKSPLEKYDLGQLKLTAVLGGIEDQAAMVENQAGIGFRVIKGTKIGTNGGEVVEILPNKIMILETTVDFTGQVKTRTVEMKLRTRDLETSNQ